ncbi:MAG: hypothetical protein ABL957_00395 [Parvularculaceae bacterium]
MFKATTSRVWSSAILLLVGALAFALVMLWRPWLIVTGKTQIPFMSDTNATYGVFSFTPQSGRFDVIKITGDFPHARYMSFMVYGGSRTQPFSSIADYQMKPDPGSVNPFLPHADRTASRRRYTLYAVREGSGIDPAVYDNVLVIPASETFATLMMRIYRPDDGLDIYGGVALPTVQAGRTGGPLTEPRYSVLSDIRAALKKYIMVRYKEAESYDQIHDDHLIDFYRLTREGGTPNADVPYIDAALGASGKGPHAKLAVLRFRPPTFEDTDNGGQRITGTKDVRYYSFCTSDVAKGFNSKCVSDNELTIDRDGMVTLVVYPPALEERVKKSGLNRLVRGYSPTVSLTYRQLLPAPDFAGAASKAPPLPLPLSGANLDQFKASTYIGEYSPTGTYYTGPQFDEWVQRRESEH